MKEYLISFIKNNIYSKIQRDKTISILTIIDNNCYINKNTYIGRGCKLKNVTINEFSYLSKNIEINNCTIGKYCSIAPNVKIGFGKHPTNYVSTSPIFYTSKNKFNFYINENKLFKEYEDINIGNDVWIGVDSIVLDGVNIGDGAIIGAGSLVTKDVPPYAIVGGVPAKIIKYRFQESSVDEFLKVKWWDWDLEKLNSLKEHVYDVRDFLNYSKFLE